MEELAEPTEQEVQEGTQTVTFQNGNGNGRHPWILQSRLPTKVQAQKYLLTNWPIIEKMARDALAAGNFEDGQSKIVMMLTAFSSARSGISGVFGSNRSGLFRKKPKPPPPGPPPGPPGPATVPLRG